MPTATAWEIAFEQDVEADRRRIERRCRVLANAGFVDVYLRDLGLDDEYELTSWGEMYLDGDVDAELQRPLPAVRPPDKVRPGWWAGFG
ncbi:winged helix-turn-helix domain-containing protein [Haloplanus halobius]|uniref:winged helix-turn-helix domain-containing protein n=1 Tax=Haloplanus halobius TaxID=2934938 RepID=UPI00200BDBCC|nr:winged helix-turn-helix domain-containing protein [Haloplanus sp. XH21]